MFVTPYILHVQVKELQEAAIASASLLLEKDALAERSLYTVHRSLLFPCVLERERNILQRDLECVLFSLRGELSALRHKAKASAALVASAAATKSRYHALQQ